MEFPVGGRGSNPHRPELAGGCDEESQLSDLRDIVGDRLLGGLVVATAATANAEVVKLQADLKGSNEVPPNSSSGSGKVTFAGLTGPAIGAHFHGPSETGKNAGIALPFKAVQSPIQGTAALTESQATDLLAGKWYANIHTTMNPGGELRGQMMK